MFTKEFTYEGPVTRYGREICRSWKGTTTAVSLEAAKSNLVYRFKAEHNMAVSIGGVDLPGKFTEKEKIK